MAKRNVEVRLRPFTANDIPHKIAWVHDPKVNRFLHFELPLTEARVLNWLERRDAENRHDFVIETTAGQPIGTVGIENLDWHHRRGEVYICIGVPDFWGTTATQNSSRQVLDYGFLQLGLNRLFIMTENLAAVGHYQKEGLNIEGNLRHFYVHDGYPRDGIIMGAVAQNYFAFRAATRCTEGERVDGRQLYIDVVQAYAFPSSGQSVSAASTVDWAEVQSDASFEVPLATLQRARSERRRGKCGELSIKPTHHVAWEPLLSALKAAAPELDSEQGSGAFESVESLCQLVEQADASKPLTPALWQAVYRALHVSLARRVSAPALVV